MPRYENFSKEWIAKKTPLFTPEVVHEKIVDYFQNIPKIKRYTKDGDEYEVIAPTIVGLALHIGFASRQSFYDYIKKDEYRYMLERARSYIEMNYEESLQGPTPTGAIFALKQFGWSDRIEQEIKQDIKVNTPLGEMLGGGSKR